MLKIKSVTAYFTRGEIILWCLSNLFIIVSFCIFDRSNYLILTASIIGAASLIFNAKGNPLGQLLMVFFSILYGIISFGSAYYGEMVTYLGMTAPMAVFSLISWLKNPYDGNKSEVKVNTLKIKEILFMGVLSGTVTFLFYHILKYFNTANLILSTLSVTTSFIAVYLTFRRSAYYAVAYAANDVVLIVLWTLAALLDKSYLSVTICFVMFLVNDVYGFISWCKMGLRQRQI